MGEPPACVLRKVRLLGQCRGMRLVAATRVRSERMGVGTVATQQPGGLTRTKGSRRSSKKPQVLQEPFVMVVSSRSSAGQAYGCPCRKHDPLAACCKRAEDLHGGLRKNCRSSSADHRTPALISPGNSSLLREW